MCLFLWLFGRRPRRLQHLLHDVEPDASLRLVLGNRVVAEDVVMAQVAGQRVAVLVGQPLVFGGVRMTGADVLGLQMLQLAVNVVAVAHFFCGSSWLR